MVEARRLQRQRQWMGRVADRVDGGEDAVEMRVRDAQPCRPRIGRRRRAQPERRLARVVEEDGVDGVHELARERKARRDGGRQGAEERTDHLPINGSGGHFTGRKRAFDQYLDSMTHLSRQCVPAGMPHYWPIWQWLPLAIKGRQWGFPPTALTVTQMRLSHQLLAFSGVVWSIDRSCADDVSYDCLGKNSTVYESCIKHIPGLPDPHCHLLCNQTWHLAPGGVAQPWGLQTLSHHIPSPGLSALQDSGGGGGQYGDRGCADAHA